MQATIIVIKLVTVRWRERKETLLNYNNYPSIEHIQFNMNLSMNDVGYVTGKINDFLIK